jgi:hypothetical protein
MREEKNGCAAAEIAVEAEPNQIHAAPGRRVHYDPGDSKLASSWSTSLHSLQVGQGQQA